VIDYMQPLRPSSEVLKDWAEDLAKKLKRPVEQILEKGLNIHDFSSAQSVEIHFPNTWFVHFDYAFAVIRPDKNAVAVFTEHSGYREIILVEGTSVVEIFKKFYVHDLE
jgi:hypothetical protein